MAVILTIIHDINNIIVKISRNSTSEPALTSLIQLSDLDKLEIDE